MSGSVEQGIFQAGEKVFVPHTDKYYEAKILKAEYRGQETGWFYFLHYNGWNKKYDEWVEEGGLVKADAAEAQGAGAAQARTNKKAAAAGVSVLAGKGGIQGGAPGGMMGRGARPAGPAVGLGLGGPGGMGMSLNAAATGPTYGLDIDMPALLKKYLVEDYECVSEDGKLVPLPRTPCIREIMEKYVAEAKDIRGGLVDAEEEVSHGLISYFDKSLSNVLLYRNERAQAAQALSDGRLPSVVYGAEHLARLLVKLPEILPLPQLTEDQLATVATMVQDVMLWMADNAATLFLPKDQYMSSSSAMVE